ncbi:MAG: RNA-binding transcriptional accessory protein [Anaerolineae bacterium]|nr:RNA-binding transcriptional accessory protein [Anaerolineae bacterium]
MDDVQRIAAQLDVRPEQVAAVVQLLDDGNTVPFVARYRKEMTGALDEEQLWRINSLLGRLRALDERRQVIVASIERQGKLGPELHRRLLAAESRAELEDLYRPYKPARRTRASTAREKGLQGLADLILQQVHTAESVERLAAPFLTDGVPTAEEAWQGARDIAAEIVSSDPDVRQRARREAFRWGVLRCEQVDAAQDDRAVYQLYYQFEKRVNRLQPHQVLAINRGEQEGSLRVRVEIQDRDWQRAVLAVYRPDDRSPLAGQLVMAIDDAAQRLLLPAIERDVRRALAEHAEDHAIKVFAANLRGLLTQPPLADCTVLGIDPGYRTGCKVAVVDPTGKVLDTTTIYPHEPQAAWEPARRTLLAQVERYQVDLIAIGNGTASRETELLAAELVRESGSLRYLVVSEAGASVYSASALARSELPDLDVSMRGAVSIARRVQDPLAELVKIDPRSIGVGLYQHDVDQRRLDEALQQVVESVVNQVGVDLNTASPALLAYVAGIGPRLAERIVAYREERARFPSRASLLDVPGVGPKAFEQAAGFLRVRDGAHPLDGSAIHPESYGIAEAVLRRAGLALATTSAERQSALERLLEEPGIAALAEELAAGVPTLLDVLEQLVRPGRDPRRDLPAPILRRDVLSLEDLQPGMRLRGTVRNVVDFGVFVDIGVKRDGLLHRRQIPAAVRLGVGDVIEVVVRSVEPERDRIGLGWPGEALNGQ